MNFSTAASLQKKTSALWNFYFWQLVRVTLVVVFGILSKILGGGVNECKFSGEDAMRWFEYSSPTIYAKEFFELIALRGDGDGETLGAPTSYLVKLSPHNISPINGTFGVCV